jgi:hypothetical protein
LRGLPPNLILKKVSSALQNKSKNDGRKVIFNDKKKTKKDYEEEVEEEEEEATNLHNNSKLFILSIKQITQ